MKSKSIVILMVALTALLSGCMRFGNPQSFTSDVYAAENTLTLQEANLIVSEALANPPTGRRPHNPGDRFIGTHVTSIRVREHKRTKYWLVEVLEGKRPFLKFYTRNRADADKFSKAVWRMKKEFSQNSIHSR